MLPKNTSRIQRDQLNIASHAQDGWEVSEDTPAVGAEVLCIEGPATVLRVHGKVSDGSRLLEVEIVDREGPSFFTPTSNVLQREGRSS